MISTKILYINRKSGHEKHQYLNKNARFSTIYDIKIKRVLEYYHYFNKNNF